MSSFQGFQPGATVYTQSFGSRPEGVEVPIIQNRAPTTSDHQVIGKRWIDTTNNQEWVLTSQSSIGGVLSSNWAQGGNEEATTTDFGVVQLATLSELQNGNAPAGAYVPTSNDVATVIQGIVVGAVPPATETQQGIAEIATQAETDAGTDDTRIVSPLKLANFIASGGFPGVFTDLTATGTVTFTGATGGINMTSATASDFGTTGAGIDLTLSSAAGRVVVNGEEAAADAVRILSAAGGLDVDVALLASITSSRNNAQAILLESTAGGIDILASGAGAGEDIDIVATGSSVNINSTENVADSIVISSTNGGIDISALGASAGEDIDITATGSSINLTSTENAALSIFLHANGGTSETIQVRADQGTGVASVELLSDAGGVSINAGLGTADAINLTTTNAAGGIDIDAGTNGIAIDTTGALVATSTANSAASIFLHANGGTSETIRLHADQGTAVTSLDLLSDVGGITLRAGLGNADAINITATNAAGGIDVDAGTAGVIVDTTGAISLDSAAASNFTVTGAFDNTFSSTAGSINISGGEAAADAVNIDAAAGGLDVDVALQMNLDSSQAAADAVRIRASNAGGGIDVDCGTGGITIDSTGAFSIDGAAASNVTTTGAGIDLTLSSVLGSVLVESTEDAALAIRLHANGGTSETIQIHADQGTDVASVGLLSDVGGITVRSTGLASADAINLEAAAGGIDMDSALQTVITSSQAAATAIQLTASDAAGGINLTSGTGNVSVTGGHLAIASVAKTLLVNGGAATDFIGTGVLTAGTVTINNTNIAAGDVILLSRTAVNASTALGELTVSISAGASFTVTSMGVTTASILVADVSSFAYFIVRPT